MTTVTVACKLPNGLVLDLPDAKSPIVLKGANHVDAIAGFGLTDVPIEFWEAWVKLYADFVPLKKELIFAQTTAKNTAAKAKEHKGAKTGLEGLDPNNPGGKLKPENFEGMSKK